MQILYCVSYNMMHCLHVEIQLNLRIRILYKKKFFFLIQCFPYIDYSEAYYLSWPRAQNNWQMLRSHFMCFFCYNWVKWRSRFKIGFAPSTFRFSCLSRFKHTLLLSIERTGILLLCFTCLSWCCIKTILIPSLLKPI